MIEVQPILNWKDYEQYKKFKISSKISLKQWAWEFLRRQPEYQKDYVTYSALANALLKEHGAAWKTNPEAKIYIPEKNQDEPDEHWLLYTENPRRQYLHLEMGSKWSLKDMYSPQAEFNEVIFIKPWNQPKLISTSYEFDAFLEEWPIGSDSAGGVQQAIGPNHAVVIFDLTTDLSPQLTFASKILVAYRRTLKNHDYLKTIDGRGNNKTWLNHLRVLDALLETPRPTNADIGEEFGCHIGQEPNEAGSAYVRDAKDVNYKKILKRAWPKKKSLPKKKK